MPTHVAVNIQIAGMSDPVAPFLSLNVQQSIAGHHKFELRVPVSVFHRSGNPAIVNDSNQLIGKQITFEFRESRTGGNMLNTFKAVITEITFNKYRGAQGDLILRGYSPTILLENGAHYASFNEQTLKDIFSKSIGEFPSNFIGTSKINPNYSDSILYSAQYNESTFNYFKRLANKYGEWFYYDGQDLVLGPPDTSNSIDINFSQNASDLNLSMRILPLKFKKTSYDYSKDELPSSPSSTASYPNLGAFGNNVIDEAESVFSFESSFITNSILASQATLDHEVKTLKNQRAANIVVLTGSSDNAALGVGKVAQITVTTPGASNEDYGKYIITSITHRTDGSGNYQNHFNGIPQTVTCPPLSDVKYPTPDIETAKVVDNKDPDKFGRLQVQMRWQAGQEKSPWLRNVSPYTGHHRGINFSAEVGDEVVIGYSDNNPDMPIVLGSFKNKSSQYSSVDAQASTKFITSRYNTMMMHDDSDDTHGISIKTYKKDVGGSDFTVTNFMTLMHEGGKGNIEVNAKDKIDIKAPTINIIGDTITINGKSLVDILSDKKVHTKAKEEINMESDQKITQKATTDFKAEGLSVTLDAQTDFKAHGLKVEVKADMQVAIEGSVQASLKGGAQLELSGGAMATLKGGMVMIN